jgi:hypothetical protein
VDPSDRAESDCTNSLMNPVAARDTVTTIGEIDSGPQR